MDFPMCGAFTGNNKSRKITKSHGRLHGAPDPSRPHQIRPPRVRHVAGQSGFPGALPRVRHLVQADGGIRIASKRVDLVNCDAPLDGIVVPF